MTYTVHLAKARFKFSASHFTIFSDDSAEALHGHNYQVGVKIVFKNVDPITGLTVDFNTPKKLIEDICQQLDEKILIPTETPLVQVGQHEHQVEAVFGNKRYSFPASDCELLPLQNVCTEELARWIWLTLKPAISKTKAVKLAVTVTETQGQAVSYSDFL